MSKAAWKTVLIYDPAQKELHDWPADVKKDVGAVLTRLQKGESPGMPDVRPMPSVAPGVAEIRVADRNGIFRNFHVIHGKYGILVFHVFVKKTQKTPEHEIKLGQLRLKEFLSRLEEDDDE